jgi:hypothetical protein
MEKAQKKGGINIMISLRRKEKRKSNRQKKRLREEILSFKNEFGIYDPTPYEAVYNLKTKRRGSALKGR